MAVKRSAVSPDFPIRPVFCPGAGYQPPGGLGRLLGATLLEEQPAIADAAIDVDDEEIKRHTVLNLSREYMYEVEQFISSVKLATADEAYLPFLASTYSSGLVRPEVRRLAFQQLMLLDTLVAMMTRSGLKEHSDLIMDRVKHLVGLEAFSGSFLGKTVELLSGRVTGFSVKRRMGKTVAIHASLAQALSFFPRAGLRALYTVHRAQAALECFTNVSRAVEPFTRTFNERQAREFHARMAARGEDERDFYYKATSTSVQATNTVIVDFYKMPAKDAVGRNALKCKGYTTEHVSTSRRVVYLNGITGDTFYQSLYIGIAIIGGRRGGEFHTHARFQHRAVYVKFVGRGG